jgi:hypothetical protein
VEEFPEVLVYALAILLSDYLTIGEIPSDHRWNKSTSPLQLGWSDVSANPALQKLKQTLGRSAVKVC